VSIGSRLAEQRAEHSLSQAEAARLGGVSREMWGKYERDTARPGADVLAGLAGAGWNVDYILTGSTRKLRNRFSAIAAANEMARLAAKGTEEFRRLQTQFFEMLVQSYDLEDEEEALLASYRACAPEDKAQIQKLAARLAPEKKTKKPLTQPETNDHGVK